MPPATRITEADVEAARRDVDDAETRHRQLNDQATAALRERREAVEDGEADRPSESEVAELFADADEAGAAVDAARDTLASVLTRRNGRDPDDQRPTDEVTARARATGHGIDVDLASALFDDDDFSAAAESGNPESVRRAMVGTTLCDADELAAMLAAQFDGSGLIPEDRRGDWHGMDAGYVGQILNWVRTGTTGRDTLEFVRQTSETINVTGIAPGDLAGESAVAFELVNEPIVNRVTGLPVPTTNLADEGRVRSAIQGRLRPGLRRDATDQVIAGDGTAGNMTGLINTAGVNTLARTSGDILAEVAHKAMTSVRTSSLTEPDGSMFNPTDWETMVLDRSSDGHWRNSGGPFAPIPLTVWGHRAGVDVAVPDVTAVVARWADAEFVIREGVSIDEFEQYADYPMRLLVLMRAMYRAGFAVEVPASFTVVDTTVVP